MSALIARIGTGIAAAAAMVLTAGIAEAGEDGWRKPHHHHHHYHGYGPYRGKPPKPPKVHYYYAPPPVVYAPAPVMYGPPAYYTPAPPPGININIPLR